MIPTTETIDPAYRPLGADPEDHDQKMQTRWEHWLRVTEDFQRYRECQLSNFEITDPRQEAAIDTVKQYLRELPDHVKNGRGLLLFGKCGSGKDHILASVLVVAVMRYGMDVGWIRGADIATDRPREKTTEERWHNYRSQTSDGERSKYQVDLLGFSDPAYAGERRPSWMAEKVTSWIDQQYNAQLAMVTSVNAAGEADLVSMLGPAAADRLLDGSTLVECDWPSYRKPA